MDIRTPRELKPATAKTIVFTQSRCTYLIRSATPNCPPRCDIRAARSTKEHSHIAIHTPSIWLRTSARSLCTRPLDKLGARAQPMEAHTHCTGCGTPLQPAMPCAARSRIIPPTSTSKMHPDTRRRPLHSPPPPFIRLIPASAPQPGGATVHDAERPPPTAVARPSVPSQRRPVAGCPAARAARWRPCQLATVQLVQLATARLGHGSAAGWLPSLGGREVSVTTVTAVTSWWARGRSRAPS